MAGKPSSALHRLWLSEPTPLQWKNYPVDNQNVKFYQQRLLKKTAPRNDVFRGLVCTSFLFSHFELKLKTSSCLCSFKTENNSCFFIFIMAGRRRKSATFFIVLLAKRHQSWKSIVALAVVAAASSSTGICSISAIFCAVWTRKAGSLRLPRQGTGAR